MKNHNARIHEPTNEPKNANLESKSVVQCELCDKSFKTMCHMSLHFRRVHNQEKNFTCDTCQKTFFAMNDYRQHKNTHESKKLYNCNFCGKGFSQPIALNIHKSTHLGKGNHKCDLCDKSFHSKSRLNSHKLSVHNKTSYKCEKCNKILKSMNNLKCHIKYVHEKVKQYKCYLCEYASARNEDLKVHIFGLHEKIRPFKCDFCEKSFHFKHKLNIHMRAVHFGEKDECKYCRELFSPTHILDHQKKCIANENYHDEKFKCDICDSDKTYASEKSLKVHQKQQHRKTIRPYPCNLCEKTFLTESLANRHIKDVHIEDPINCTYCNKTMRPISLPLHLKTCTTQKSKEDKVECENCHQMLTLDHLKRKHSKFCVSKIMVCQ